MAAPLATAAPNSAPDLLLLLRRRHRAAAAPLLRLQFQANRRQRASRFLLRSVSEDRVAVTEPKEADSYGLNGNGSGRGLRYEEVVEERGSNGSVEEMLNGNGNGGLMRYEGGNGASAAASASGRSEEEGRKKRVEEIGKEDAWFKTPSPQPQVSVTPGGRWNRFKTYSTIQRTLEIWGFVFAFIFKAWLNNQKFSYRGGMTEEKKVLRRRALAKWLKESILRLGPTFIKIGQQFSTRVDILAQEYVDQLSELQVKILDHMIHAPITP